MSNIRGSHRTDAEDSRLLEHDAASLGGWFATLRSIKLPSLRLNGPETIYLGLLALQYEGNTIFRNVGNYAPNDTAPYCRRRGSSSTTFLYIGRPKDNQNRAEIRCTFHWQSLVILAAKLMASRTIKNIFRKNLPGNTSYKPETGKFKDRPSYFAVPFFNTPNSFREISRLNF